MELHFPGCIPDLYGKVSIIQATEIYELLNEYEEELGKLNKYLRHNTSQIIDFVDSADIEEAVEQEYKRMDNYYITKLKSIVGDTLELTVERQE